jgi:glycosyltransferase involved in cell wall biosynthesis
MKISIVIPAYNEERCIGECLAAVEREVARFEAERPDVEVETVVVNNASKDRTKEVAQQFKDVKVVDELNKGLVRARHAGYVATDGELVANIDADTQMPAGWLSTVIEEFENNPKLVALSGPYLYYDLPAWKNMLVKTWYAPGWLFDRLIQPLTGHATMLQGGNFIIRRSAWDEAGGFDTSIEFYGEDADVARRISRYGRVLWTWRLTMPCSGRRLAKEGLMGSALNYIIGLFATHMTGTAPKRGYTDVRPE